MVKYKNILITGATSGIGEALALYYAKNGAKNLFLCGRDADRLNTVRAKCSNFGAAVFAEQIDVTDRSQVKNWILKCEQTAPLNLVIANAGIATLQETDENIYRTFDTNVNGVLNTVLPAIHVFEERTAKAAVSNPDSSLDRFISKMKKEKRAFSLNLFTRRFLGSIGSELHRTDDKAIAITSSIAGYHGLSTCPSYSASKACVKAWGEALRIEMKRKNINVSVICPGFIRSRITERNTCPMPFFMEAGQAAAIIAKRIDKNVGLIAFPWPMRLAAWLGSVLPSRISEFIYARLPYKV